MRFTKIIVTMAATAVTVLGTTLVGVAPASTAADARVTAYAPADTAEITPGVQMYTNGAQCTGNFVFSDSAGNTYVGYAAHCAGLGEATDTNGCLERVGPARHRRHLQQGRVSGLRGHPGRLRHPGLQLVAHHAREGRVRRQHLRLQRLRPGEGQRRPTPARSTRASRSGAARPASTPTAPPPATGSGPTATPACAAASPSSRPRPASASATAPRTAAGATRSTP